MRWVLIVLMMSASALSGATMEVTVPETPTTPFDPIKGRITITHNPSEEIDLQSFQMEGRPLAVDFIEKQEEDGVVRSFFHFDIMPQEEGLNALPSIRALVGEETVASPAIIYEVVFQIPDSGLRLKAFVEGETPFYPGERLKFIYKIYFLGNVQLTRDQLPLIEAEGFEKIGPLRVTESEEKGFKVQIITQDVEAVAPGDFTFEESILEGIIDGSKKVQTSVEPFILTIEPFPVETKPANFIGTGGSFTVRSRLTSPRQIKVGDKISLELVFRGDGNLESLNLPNLFCQPGIMGFFDSTRAPPVSSIEGNRKTFTVEMVPLTHLVNKIPPFSFSIYDSRSNVYSTISTRPLSLKVAPVALPELSRPPVAQKKEGQSQRQTPLLPAKQIKTKRSPALSWPHFIATFSFAGFALLAQYLARDRLLKIWRRPKQMSRQRLINEALRYSLNDRRFYLKMREAASGIESDKAYAFRRELDAIRYGNKHVSKERLLVAAREVIA